MGLLEAVTVVQATYRAHRVRQEIKVRPHRYYGSPGSVSVSVPSAPAGICECGHGAPNKWKSISTSQGQRVSHVAGYRHWALEQWPWVCARRASVHSSNVLPLYLSTCPHGCTSMAARPCSIVQARKARLGSTLIMQDRSSALRARAGSAGAAKPGGAQRPAFAPPPAAPEQRPEDGQAKGDMPARPEVCPEAPPEAAVLAAFEVGRADHHAAVRLCSCWRCPAPLSSEPWPDAMDGGGAACASAAVVFAGRLPDPLKPFLWPPLSVFQRYFNAVGTTHAGVVAAEALLRLLQAGGSQMQEHFAACMPPASLLALLDCRDVPARCAGGCAGGRVSEGRSNVYVIGLLSWFCTCM